MQSLPVSCDDIMAPVPYVTPDDVRDDDVGDVGGTSLAYASGYFSPRVRRVVDAAPTEATVWCPNDVWRQAAETVSRELQKPLEFVVDDADGRPAHPVISDCRRMAVL